MRPFVFVERDDELLFNLLVVESIVCCFTACLEQEKQARERNKGERDHFSRLAQQINCEERPKLCGSHAFCSSLQSEKK